MPKSADAFRTISEVADWLETPAHVLRFWESKFNQVKPVKRAGGRRYYRPADMKLLGGIKKLLHDDGMTIKGVQKVLREEGVAHVSDLSQPLGDAADDVVIDHRNAPGQPPEPASTPPAPPPDDVQPEPPEPVPGPQAMDTPAPPPEDARPEPPEPVPGPQAMETPAPDAANPERSDAPEMATTSDPEPQPEIAFSHKSDPTPEEPTATRDAPEEDELEQDGTEQDQPEQDKPAPLPNFLKRRDEGDEPPTEASPTPEPDPEPEPEPTPRPLEITVPEDPDDSVTAEPGLLSVAARLPRPLSVAQAERLEPVLQRLRETAASTRGGQG